jgi:uncharacterized protein
MKLGILSDTHGLLRNETFAALEGVDHILHAGDLGPLDLLVELEALAPVTAVHGNTDGWEVRHCLPEAAQVTLQGLRFQVVHGHLPSQGTTPLRLARIFPDADVVIFGHTHQPLLECHEQTRWFVNPGSAGPQRFHLPVTLVRAEIRDGQFHPTLIHLLDGSSTG